MATYTLKDYIQLIEAFTSGAMLVAEFEREYLQRFQEDDTHRPREQFQVLDGLFADVDAYCADPALRGEDDLDEASLRVRAEAALGRLRELSKTSPPKRKVIELPYPRELRQAAAGPWKRTEPIKASDFQLYVHGERQVLWVELKNYSAPPIAAHIHLWGGGREGRWPCPIGDVERTEGTMSVYLDLGTPTDLRREATRALGKLPEAEEAVHFEVELEFPDATDTGKHG